MTPPLGPDSVKARWPCHCAGVGRHSGLVPQVDAMGFLLLSKITSDIDDISNVAHYVLSRQCLVVSS